MTNDPMNLDEPVELAGIWWLPDKPDEKIPGILRYDGKGAVSLSLVGAFEDRIVSHPSPGVIQYDAGDKTWDAIHGVADRSEITLLDCVPIRSQRILFARVKGPDTQLIRATLAVVGAHISGEEDPVFAAAEVSIDDLAIWAASSEFVTSLCTDNDGKIGGVNSVSMKPVEAQMVTVDATEYSLLHIRPWPSIDFCKGEVVGRMKDTVRIRIHRSELLTLRAALEEASRLQDLIALATHSSAGVIWPNLRLRGQRRPFLMVSVCLVGVPVCSIPLWRLVGTMRRVRDKFSLLARIFPSRKLCHVGVKRMIDCRQQPI